MPSIAVSFETTATSFVLDVKIPKNTGVEVLANHTYKCHDAGCIFTVAQVVPTPIHFHDDADYSYFTLILGARLTADVHVGDYLERLT